MSNMSTFDPSLIYGMMKGEPGTRKSTQALSFLDAGPMFWFSWDRKMQSLIVPARKWGYDLKNIEYEDYEDWTKPKAKLESFQLKCPYKTLVFDSVTSMADMTLRQTLKSKGGLVRGSGKAAGYQIAGIAINEMEDYNAESSALNELIAITKDIHTFHKVNIILIAHVMEVSQKSKEGEVSYSRTIVTAGKRVAAKVPAYCTEVYHFNIKRGFNADGPGEYSLFTESTTNDFARSALDLAPEIVFNDKPLYKTWLAPAIEKMKISPPKSF